ncbi:MAG: hypothetical protein ABIJ91_04955 [Candidatus Kuenenbacteria bacterium]
MRRHISLIAIIVVIIGCAKSQQKFFIGSSQKTTDPTNTRSTAASTKTFDGIIVQFDENTFLGISRTKAAEIGILINETGNYEIKHEIAQAIKKDETLVRLFEKVPIPGNQWDRRGTVNIVTSTGTYQGATYLRTSDRVIYKGAEFPAEVFDAMVKSK